MIKSIADFEFCWTSRRRFLWRQCRRRYFYHYYGARGGNEPDAPRFVRELYTAKITLPLPVYLRRVVNMAMREIFYAPLEADQENAETTSIAEAAFKIAELEFHQYLSENDLPPAICADWLNDSVRPGYIFDDMCESLSGLCAKIENGAWSQLKNSEFACRRYLESPLILNVGELKCAITPILALRRSADFWLISSGGTESYGDEISALARFAFYNLWKIKPEQVKIFVLKSDDSGTFSQVGIDADFSAVFSGIRKDVDDMLKAVRANGTVAEADFPCNTSECGNCPFKNLCPREK